MSVTLNIRGYSGKESKRFQQQLAVVKSCIENEIDFPEETKEFFKGKVDGLYDLNEVQRSVILKGIENGIEVNLPTYGSNDYYKIKVADIPKEVTDIIISLS